MEALQRFSIHTRADVEQACRAGRRLAATLGFGMDDVERVVLAVSELSTNLLRYAVHGEVALSPAHSIAGDGLCIESRDEGPGIADLGMALRDGISTGGGLGSGLAGVRRLMDEMTVTTAPRGTTIVVYKWLTTP